MSKAFLRSAYDEAYKYCLSLIEKDMVPDWAIRRGIRYLLSQRLAKEILPSVEEMQKRKLDFVNELRGLPVAVQTEAANEQHYEVPTEFFKLCLGKWLKYSSCLYKTPNDSLEDAEENMLGLYCGRAHLKDGQSILELGCGWGSLTLFLGTTFPNSTITAVSNSSTQKAHIDGEAKKRGLTNINVITKDVVDFEAPDVYDRVISIEMFEHMKNYEELLKRISRWLKPDGLLFIHYFCHKEIVYHFRVETEDDWMSKYFFSGGTMGSLDLMLYFQNDLKVESIQYVNGVNYSRTLEAWLVKMDTETDRVMEIFKETYGEKDANKWRIYWRLFYLACSELFNLNNGNEYGLAHVLFSKRQ